ncbi:MAG TPA: hypothetical protein VJN92_08875 [Candidatus Acidoferrum sp.]|nr:hypothetical protein [Candidatus Acidoferrum sp.]
MNFAGYRALKKMSAGEKIITLATVGTNAPEQQVVGQFPADDSRAILESPKSSGIPP